MHTVHTTHSEIEKVTFYSVAVHTALVLTFHRYTQTNPSLFIDRILSAHGGIAPTARSEYPAAVPPSEGLQGPSVSALLLPHVRLGHGPAKRSPWQGRRGRVAVATERRAEHRLAEGHGGVPE